MNLTDNRTSTICFYLIITRWINPNQTIRLPRIFNYFDKINKYFSATVASICSQHLSPSTFISHIFTHYLLIENHPGKQLYLLLQKSYISKSIPLAKMKSLHPLLPVSVYNLPRIPFSFLSPFCSYLIPNKKSQQANSF